MGKRESNVFVYDCGTHYSNCNLLFFTAKLIVFEVRTGKVYQMFNVKDAHAFTNDLLFAFSN